MSIDKTINKEISQGRDPNGDLLDISLTRLNSQKVEDGGSVNTLEKILNELQKMNLHLSILTDTILKDEDII